MSVNINPFCRKFPALALLLLSLSVSKLASAQDAYSEKIRQHRDSISSAMSDTALSILTNAEIEKFSGLKYYPVSPSYCLPAKFIRIKKTETFEMITNTSRRPVFRVYGKLRFSLDGKTYELFVYKSENPHAGYENWLFCPFTDLTSGDESYGGGRYLDFEIKDMENPVIDFNLCYNPYCAYSDRFSCPVPPKENFLNVKIEAGEKKYHE